MPETRQTRIGAKGSLLRTPATPSMIVASLDAGKRVDEGLVTHV